MSTSQSGQASALRVVEPQESASLRKVKRGEMSLDEYLDEQVESALDHLRGRIPQEKLDSIRIVLREKLQYDPLLLELVRRTTGQTPLPLDDAEGTGQ